MGSRDWIELAQMKLECIVGILDEERVQTQPLLLDIELHLDLDAASRGLLVRTVDYGSFAEQAATIAVGGKWYLLESLATAICALALAPPCVGEERALVDSVTVRARKPKILNGLAVPGISITRDQDWLKLSRQTVEEGVVFELLLRTPQSESCRLHIAPGCSWRVPPNASVMIVAGRARYDGGIIL
ncbi:MAG: dihydroneopterin aldolase, partial [Proteobacteria bacterium]|nr:dihydroneopterin aldolase [Pseudomonadota bacterium]